MMEDEKVQPIYLLTGDIGGTNSRMALYDASSPPDSAGRHQPIVEKYYRNSEHILEANYKDPEVFQANVIMPFLKHCWDENSQSKDILAPLRQVQIVATFAVAGFVLNNRVNLTNLGSMLIDGTAIAANTKDRYLKQIVVCRIINDFVAVRFGCSKEGIVTLWRLVKSR
jgi:glucokinase